MIDHVGDQLAGRGPLVLTAGDELAAGARTISTLISGKRLLNALMTCCSTSAKFAV